MIRGVVLTGVLLAACKTGGESADISEETKTGTDPTRGSAGGFSAGLTADLSGSRPGSAGSDAGSAVGAGSAAGTGSGSGSGSGSTGAGSGSGSGAGSGSATASGSGSAGTGSGSGSAIVKIEPKPVEVKAGSGSAVAIAAPPKPVAMTPEMQAIKLSLQPNWVRDVAGPGTVSLQVNVQSRDLTTTFRFAYGYEDPSAPTDRDAYKKWLAATKQMSVTTDRQRGAAWYLEGPDGANKMSFRIVVLYGGKRLICGGSSYKESDLGDIRDQVVIQAKSICETIAL